jgi:hypothetical protein
VRTTKESILLIVVVLVEVVVVLLKLLGAVPVIAGFIAVRTAAS